MAVKKSKKTARKRKPKVTLNKTGVIALSSILIGLCVVSLIVATITSTPKVDNIEKIAEITQQSQKIDDSKTQPDKQPQVTVTQSSSDIKLDTSKKSTNQSTQGSPKATVSQESKTSADVKKSNSDVNTQKKTESSKTTEKTTSSSSTTQSKAAESKSSQTSNTKTSTPPKEDNKKVETASVNNKQNDNNAIQEANKAKKNPYNIPKASKGATLVFVIDDAGLNVENVKKYVSLPFPISVAVLPKLSHSKECAQVVRNAGKEVLLHQPMQATNLSINPGPGAITPDMSSYEIAAVLKQNIAEVGPVKGLNNHEGSLITENAIKMGFILDIATEEGIYFLDSRTTSQSQARQAALERDIKIYERNAPFLDNAISRDEMLTEIYKGLAIANKSGTAIIIGHVDKSVKILPDLLKDMYPYLVEAGYRFAVPSAL